MKVGWGLAAAIDRLRSEAAPGVLGDFTTSPRALPLSALAAGIGVTASFAAWALLKLIGVFTNLFFYQRWSPELVSPAANTLGLLEVLVPVAGAVAVGLMARYGSERIRGHGIPEAIEAILLNGGRVEPKVAALKPISAAVSIGSGGPFGAEGPIIMTGGALGSMIAQLFHLTSAERRTLLVAGAAAGMSATFASPVAAVLLSVELPIFPVPAHAEFVGPVGLAGCVLAGLLAGGLSVLLTLAVYKAEDAFQKLPIHWMWWPALGGLVIGLGGLVYPQALGVGYDTIGRLLQGEVPRHAILGLLLVKSVIWAVSLGSGTSGGVLAPLLMMGGALGGLEALVLPAEGVGFWPLVSMGAILGGTMRSPLTGVVFALEITHDVNALLPLLLATTTAHAFTVLVLRRSILTEKVARRGYHLSREYSVDPLEILFTREVMRTKVAALPGSLTLAGLTRSLHADVSTRGQRLYPVVDNRQRLLGVVTRNELAALDPGGDGSSRPLADAVKDRPVVAHPDEPLRVVAYRMAETGFTRLPVVDRASRELCGLVSLEDLLKARALTLEAEQRRERVSPGQLFFPRRKTVA